MTNKLIGSLAASDGREVTVTVGCEGRDGEANITRSFTLPRSIYDSLGLPGPGEDVDEETMYELAFADEQYRAIKKTFDILAFGKNSARTLTRKLGARGFSADAILGAVDYMKNHGYLKEEEDAVREAECCVTGKLYGRKRVLMHLHEKGYDGEALAAAMEYLDTVDFVDVCVKLIRAKYKTLPKEEKEHQKVIAGLFRAGFSMSEIKAAAKIVEYYRLPGNI